MSIHGFMDQNGQIQKYDYADLENKPTIPAEVLIDDTLTEEGQAADAKAVRDALENVTIPIDSSLSEVSTNPVQNRVIYQALQSSGLSQAIKTALLAIFQHVAYVDEHGQEYYDDLEEALYPRSVYTITNTLTGCTSTNTAIAIMDGDSYNATIIPSYGYTLTGADISIMIGGETVTGFYNNGVISIPNVTGDLAITVIATSSVSSISAAFTQGQNVVTNVDSLESLRQYLVVTATYMDSTTSVVSGYTLSGTLSIGTSTITVSYGGETDTFTVAVTDSGYLYYWDFTDSLVDRVQGAEAELYNLPGITSTGIRFSDHISTGFYVAIKLGDIFGYNKAIEIDLRDVSNAANSSGAVISLCAGDASVAPGQTYDVFGYHYSTTAANDRFGIVAYNVQHWSMNANTSVGKKGYLDGSCTIKFQIDSNGVMSVFKDGVDLNAVYPVSSSGSRPTISAENCVRINIGAYTPDEITTGTDAGYWALHNEMTIAGARIYSL